MRHAGARAYNMGEAVAAPKHAAWSLRSRALRMFGMTLGGPIRGLRVARGRSECRRDEAKDEIWSAEAVAEHHRCFAWAEVYCRCRHEFRRRSLIAINHRANMSSYSAIWLFI